MDWFSSTVKELAAIHPTVGGALIGVFGVMLTVVVGFVASYLQRRAEAKRLRNTREFELRRDHLLQLAEISTMPTRLYNDLLKAEVPVAAIGEKTNAVAGMVSRCLCILTLPTLEAALKANEVFARALFTMLRTRTKIDLIDKKLALNNAQIAAIEKAVQLAYATATPESAKLIRQYQTEVDGVHQYNGRLHDWRAARFFELQDMVRESVSDYGRYQMDLQIAIRTELSNASEKALGLAVSVPAFAELLNASLTKNQMALRELSTWAANLVEWAQSDDFVSKPDGAVAKIGG